MEQELRSLLASEEGVSVREASASRCRPRSCALGTSLVLLLLGFVGVWAHQRSVLNNLRSGAVQESASMLVEAPNPPKLKPLDCNTGFPIQVRNDRKESWDLETLDVRSGKYQKLASIPRSNPKLHQLNACAINPKDDFVYCCVMELTAGRTLAEYWVVRLGIVGLESQQAGIEFVAQLPKKITTFEAGAFDLDGNFCTGTQRLVFLKDLHTEAGKSFESRHEASDRTSTPAWRNGGCASGDWAFMLHGDLKLLWLAHERKFKTLDISGGPDVQPKCQTWTARGAPVQRKYGAAWTFTDAKGNHRVYMATNDKSRGQIVAIDPSSLDTKAWTVGLEKMPDAEAIERWNDGVSCMNAPPPWPTKEAKAPEPAPKAAKAGYEWVLMGESTVCRADQGDHDTLPDTPSITLAHDCHYGPCKTLGAQIPMTVKECQKRCEDSPGCNAVEIRKSEDRCEILEQTTKWFQSVAAKPTVSGPPDFQCWFYKPSCDSLKAYQDNGAKSETFSHAWSICFPS